MTSRILNRNQRQLNIDFEFLVFVKFSIGIMGIVANNSLRIHNMYTLYINLLIVSK